MALPPSWAWVLVGCASVSLAGAFSLSDLYPPLWQESPGQFSDYRVENGKYVIDPWVFTDRMGMYKVLLNRTAKYFAKFGPENEQNLLWGLALQHGWQYSSGRLADPSRQTDCGYKSDALCVSVSSWSADFNYFLSVLPFLAALDSGIMGTSPDKVTLLPPPKDQMRFCYNVSGCRSSFPDTMNRWRVFYEGLISGRELLRIAQTTALSCLVQSMQLPFIDFEELLKSFWMAHTASLKIFDSAFEDRYDYYSTKEAEYEKNRIVYIQYLAVSLIPPTLRRMHMFQEGMPPRVLVDKDTSPVISDFTGFQNLILLELDVVAIVFKFTGTLSLVTWKVLMSTPASRRKFLHLFDLLLQLLTTK